MHNSADLWRELEGRPNVWPGVAPDSQGDASQEKTPFVLRRYSLIIKALQKMSPHSVGRTARGEECRSQVCASLVQR